MSFTVTWVEILIFVLASVATQLVIDYVRHRRNK